MRGNTSLGKYYSKNGNRADNLADYFSYSSLLTMTTLFRPFLRFPNQFLQGVPVVFTVLISLLALSACKFENADLTATSKIPQMGPDCASCHGYSLRDTNHVYHLFTTNDSSITNNRPITCLHCHNLSIVGRDTNFLDTVYRDTNGNEFHTLDFPDLDEIRTYQLLRVEILVQNRPIAMPSRPGPKPEITEWMTALAHMNGRVDVNFNKTSIDTVRFKGAKAVYNPKEMTCSAMACHPNPGKYRWAVPSRGWLMLTGDTLLNKAH